MNNGLQEKRKKQGPDTLYVASVEKAFGVLKAFRIGQWKLGLSDLSLTQISQISQLDKSASQRFTNTLVELGYLEKDQRTRRYRPGVELLDLGYTYLVSSRLSEIATSRLIAASKIYGTTANLAIQHGSNVVYVVRIPQENTPFRVTLIGRRIPMFSASAGIVMLAGQSDKEIEESLSSWDFKAQTEWTITDPKKVRARIEAARSDGFAIGVQQSLPEEISTAAPVLNSEGKAIAAVQIPVYMPHWTVEMAQEKIAPLVMETARAISGSYFTDN
jgi:DNA-binding IclR family transcriptional regulator